MPELPEVETVRRGLAPMMEGRRLVHVIQRRPDLRWPLPDRFPERLIGKQVGVLGRRSKYLLIPLDSGETLIIHLGMSGRLLIQADSGRAHTADFAHAAAALTKHDHVAFFLKSGGQVVFNDARRFGAMDLTPTDDLDAHPWLARLGPEPLSNAFNGAALAAALVKRKAAIKPLLLDQRIVAGLGNIYVCEALHMAGISPLRPGGAISPAECDALAAAIRATLQAAIEAGGSSLKDYRRADGELGYFQHSFAVYGRAGQPCPRAKCGGHITAFAQGGRTTSHCPRCQV